MELSNDLKIVIIVGLMQIIQKMLSMMWGWTKSDTAENQALITERQHYMTFMQTMLDGFITQIAKLGDTFKESIADVITAMEKHNETTQRTIQSRLDQSLGHMTGVTQKREEADRKMRTDIQTVPAETVRLLKEPLANLETNTTEKIIQELSNARSQLEAVIDHKTSLIDEAIQALPVRIRAAVNLELEDLKMTLLKTLEQCEKTTDDVTASAERAVTGEQKPELTEQKESIDETTGEKEHG